MAEIRTVTTLRRKRDEIRRAIRNYEHKLDQAKADLAHIAAAISIFEAKGGDTELPAYADIQRLFRYAEGIELARETLADGPKTTREIAPTSPRQRAWTRATRLCAKSSAARSFTSYGGRPSRVSY